MIEKNNKEGLLVECNTYELLALNNILLLKVGQCSSLMKEYFSNTTLAEIKGNIKAKLNIKCQGIKSDVKTGVDTVLKVSDVHWGLGVQF